MSDDLTVTDWNSSDISNWSRYVGARVREVWNALPYDLRERIVADAIEQSDRDWSDSIDAMGEDA